MPFKIVEGGMTAIVGPSGSGKSTLAKLLVSFWEADRGRILLGGWMSASSRCPGHAVRRLCLAGQFPVQRQPAGNIRLGRPDATDRKWKRLRRLPRAASSRHCPADVTPAGDAGAPFRGARPAHRHCAGHARGQPHRGADEATALPIPKNEAFIQESISRLVMTRRWWSLHRLSTIVRADRIVVMGQPRVRRARTRNCCNLALYGRLWESHTGARMPKER